MSADGDRASPGDLDADLALLTDAAVEAGELARRMRAAGLSTRGKADGSPVTDADMAVDALLTRRLRDARPAYGWLSEETADDPVRLAAERVFIVDPIDGTTAFLKGRAEWVVSVAVVEDGRALAGVVHAPALDETYAARLGGGATLNGAAIAASGRGTLEGAAMLGDPALFTDPRWPEPWPALTVTRRTALAYRMALVAAGAFDAMLALGSKHEWDLAAGAVIAAEAGAVATDRLGASLRFNTPAARVRSLVCATPALHPLILARVAGIDLAD